MFGLAAKSLLGAGVLGDGLGSLRDGVFGQLAREEETDSGLDFPGGDGGQILNKFQHTEVGLTLK